jgi:hypothetical protein
VDILPKLEKAKDEKKEEETEVDDASEKEKRERRQEKWKRGATNAKAAAFLLPSKEAPETPARKGEETQQVRALVSPHLSTSQGAQWQLPGMATTAESQEVEEAERALDVESMTTHHAERELPVSHQPSPPGEPRPPHGRRRRSSGKDAEVVDLEAADGVERETLMTDMPLEPLAQERPPPPSPPTERKLQKEEETRKARAAPDG